MLAMERDALGLALMIAEIDRTELLTWREPTSQRPFFGAYKGGLQLKIG
jgi:hypothetical protein